MKKLSVRILTGPLMRALKCTLMCTLMGVFAGVFPALVSAAGVSEPAPVRDSRSNRSLDQQTRSMQQRKDLRQALQPQQGKGEELADRPLADRHLTAQERAEMRQQLRQQRQDTGRGKP